MNSLAIKSKAKQTAMNQAKIEKPKPKITSTSRPLKVACDDCLMSSAIIQPQKVKDQRLENKLPKSFTIREKGTLELHQTRPFYQSQYLSFVSPNAALGYSGAGYHFSYKYTINHGNNDKK